jgi:hypothetical protein
MKIEKRKEKKPFLFCCRNCFCSCSSGVCCGNDDGKEVEEGEDIFIG